MMKTKFLLTALLLFSLWSCQKDIDPISNDPIDPSSTDLTDLVIPANFNFNTTEVIDMTVSVNGLNDQPLSGVKVSFYTAHPDFDGEFISAAFTNAFGQLSTEINLPSYLEEIFVQVHSVGFANQQTVSLAPQMSLEFGGIPESRETNRTVVPGPSEPIHISDNYYYMGEFNTGSWKGLPWYLEYPGDELDQAFLDDVNASLPEGEPVPDFNPEYLTTSNELDVVVNDLSDVWITFVTEGAGYRNALGYYVFDTDNPPANPSEIDSIHIVLPNASLVNSSGELYAGDKVKLGTFEGGKTISWVLFQNAWTGNGVNVNATKFFSKADFNTSESDPDMRQHTVQLMDIGRQLLLNGFEDLYRSDGRSDEDFNDLVFYVSANPWENIEIGEIPQVTPESDDDDDGISNAVDDFPEDPNLAVKNSYQGNVAYEDLWPSKGDYDFNDLVMHYEVDHYLNGSNQVVSIDADWSIEAVGAGFQNGFGFEFDGVAANQVASVTGSQIHGDIVTNNSNGTEANQTNATIIVFENVYNHIQSAGGQYINCIPSNPYTEPVTLSLNIAFNSPVPQSSVGIPPYDAFLFVNGNRSKEIHLPGNDPTDLADDTYLGSGSDASNSAQNYYYKTANGLPWAINITGDFDHPIELEPIDEAYLNFANWAASGGTIHKDWHLNISGNRNSSKIY